MADDYAEQIHALSGEIARLSRERERLLQKWAAQVSPWKIDQITNVRGYSFLGKQCKVKQVYGKLSYSGQPLVRVTATVLKKDGNLGQNVADWEWRPGEQI